MAPSLSRAPGARRASPTRGGTPLAPAVRSRPEPREANGPLHLHRDDRRASRLLQQQAVAAHNLANANTAGLQGRDLGLSRRAGDSGPACRRAPTRSTRRRAPISRRACSSDRARPRRRDRGRRLLRGAGARRHRGVHARRQSVRSARTACCTTRGGPRCSATAVRSSCRRTAASRSAGTARCPRPAPASRAAATPSWAASSSSIRPTASVVKGADGLFRTRGGGPARSGRERARSPRARSNVAT